MTRRAVGISIVHLLAVCIGILLMLAPFKAHALDGDDVSGVLSEWFSGTGGSAALCLGCSRMTPTREVAAFYHNRLYRPVWVGKDGLNRAGYEFFHVLETSARHGLNRENFDYDCIKAWLAHQTRAAESKTSLDDREKAALDVLLTTVFYHFGSQLSRGRVDARRIYSLWLPSRNDPIDPLSVLNRLEKDGDVEQALRWLAPPHPEYWQLVEAGERLRSVAEKGGWIQVPKARLEMGDRDLAVSFLRRRLIEEGDLKILSAGGDNLIDEKRDDDSLFDENLDAALKRFQARHGLETDGIVGPATLAELNVTADERYRQIMANIERWRWLPQNWGSRYVIVNAADFSLKGFEDGHEIIQMRVVVGKPATMTPIFSDRFEFIEINPYWYVPESIHPEIFEISQEKLDLRGYEEIGESGIRQKPGPLNALGQLKFIFPNQFSVYLHDTPSKNHFKRDFRAFSHGCVRVEKPVDLAVFLLENKEDWDRERIERIITSGTTKRVKLDGDTEVHIVYITAWVGADGEMEYRRDLYKRDSVLARSLQTASPAALTRASRDVSLGDCPRLMAGSAVSDSAGYKN